DAFPPKTWTNFMTDGTRGAVLTAAFCFAYAQWKGTPLPPFLVQAALSSFGGAFVGGLVGSRFSDLTHLPFALGSAFYSSALVAMGVFTSSTGGANYSGLIAAAFGAVLSSLWSTAQNLR